MRSIIRYFIISLIHLFFLINPALYGYDNIPDNLPANNTYPDINSKYFILPQIGLQIEDRGFAGNNAGYKMETRRIVDIDAFKINNIIFSFFLNESLLYNREGPNYINPRSISYEMDFGNLRWESGYGILSLFCDHLCQNIINDNQTGSKQLRWYGFGLRWESYGLKTGRKDIKIYPRNYNSFNILNNLNYRLSVERSIHTRDFNYEYMFSGTLRYDILNYFLIPYIEGSFSSLLNGHAKINRYFETGIRMHSDNGNITPFIGFNHKYDINYRNGADIDLFYIGLRMETLIANDTGTETTKSKEIPLFPGFHFRGSYGKFIADENLNFNADILIGIELFSSGILSPFFSNRLMHSSLKESTGMYPRYIQDNIECGLSYKLDLINSHIEPFYRYTWFGHGNYYSGYDQQFSEAGLRIIKSGMKTGFGDNSAVFTKTSGFNWINKIEWSFSAAGIFKEKHYNYDLDYGMDIRWNILKYNKTVPYISSGVNILKGGDYNKIYNIESGIMTRNGIYWIFFYKFEYRTETDPVNGLFRTYHLAGIRFEI